MAVTDQARKRRAAPPPACRLPTASTLDPPLQHQPPSPHLDMCALQSLERLTRTPPVWRGNKLGRARHGRRARDVCLGSRCRRRHGMHRGTHTRVALFDGHALGQPIRSRPPAAGAAHVAPQRHLIGARAQVLGESTAAVKIHCSTWRARTASSFRCARVRGASLHLLSSDAGVVARALRSRAPGSLRANGCNRSGARRARGRSRRRGQARAGAILLCGQARAGALLLPTLLAGLSLPVGPIELCPHAVAAILLVVVKALGRAVARVRCPSAPRLVSGHAPLRMQERPTRRTARSRHACGSRAGGTHTRAGRARSRTRSASPRPPTTTVHESDPRKMARVHIVGT